MPVAEAVAPAVSLPPSPSARDFPARRQHARRRIAELKRQTLLRGNQEEVLVEQLDGLTGMVLDADVPRLRLTIRFWDDWRYGLRRIAENDEARMTACHVIVVLDDLLSAMRGEGGR